MTSRLTLDETAGCHTNRQFEGVIHRDPAAPLGNDGRADDPFGLPIGLTFRTSDDELVDHILIWLFRWIE